MSETLYDVRIMEKYNRERILVELRRVTKTEALRMVGALMMTRPQGGGNTWVQPRVSVNSGKGWVEQSLDLPRTAGRTLDKWCDFIGYRMPSDAS